MKLNVSWIVQCKPSFSRTHYLISNCIVSNCLSDDWNLGQPNSWYIKTRPSTNKTFKLKINRDNIFWESLLSLLEYIIHGMFLFVPLKRTYIIYNINYNTIIGDEARSGRCIFISMKLHKQNRDSSPSILICKIQYTNVSHQCKNIQNMWKGDNRKRTKAFTYDVIIIILTALI